MNIDDSIVGITDLKKGLPNFLRFKEREVVPLGKRGQELAGALISPEKLRYLRVAEETARQAFENAFESIVKLKKPAHVNAKRLLMALETVMVHGPDRTVVSEEGVDVFFFSRKIIDEESTPARHAFISADNEGDTVVSFFDALEKANEPETIEIDIDRVMLNRALAQEIAVKIENFILMG